MIINVKNYLTHKSYNIENYLTVKINRKKEHFWGLIAILYYQIDHLYIFSGGCKILQRGCNFLRVGAKIFQGVRTPLLEIRL